MTVRDESWKPELHEPGIQAYILEEVGEEGLEIAAYIEANQPVSGVDVLEHYEDRKPSSVRKVLYALMEAHVAEYEKDTDAKGWETFTWQLTLNEVKYVLLRRWRDELANLRRQLKFEQEHEFYAGPSRMRRMVFEDAMEIGFQCPVTGEPMEPVDNTPVIEALEQRGRELADVLEA